MAAKKPDKALAALRALDRILDFKTPDQLYVFTPADAPTWAKAWKQAASVIASAKR